MQYNTSKERMIIKEYGRSVHDMVKYLLTIDDKEKRQKNAEAVIEIMAMLNPQLKSAEDYQHKLWDHLFMISDYQLDIECPYPKPTKEVKQQKPTPLPYPKQKIKWNHLGKSFENLFEKAMEESDEEKKKGYISVLALFMKVAYNNWHKETIPEDMIKDELAAMSKGKLILEPGVKFSENVDTSTSATILTNIKNTIGKKGFNNRNNQPRFGNKNGNGNNRSNKFNRFKKKN